MVMKIVAAKNDPEKLKEIAKGLAGPQDGPAPGLRFVKPEVTPGEPLKLEFSRSSNRCARGERRR